MGGGAKIGGKQYTGERSETMANAAQSLKMQKEDKWAEERSLLL